MPPMTVTGDQQPFLRVMRGKPTDAELAALVAVLAGRAGAAGNEPPRPGSAWADPAARLRRPVHAGLGAWRRSGLPG